MKIRIPRTKREIEQHAIKRKKEKLLKKQKDLNKDIGKSYFAFSILSKMAHKSVAEGQALRTLIVMNKSKPSTSPANAANNETKLEEKLDGDDKTKDSTKTVGEEVKQNT
jgi:hypothetical protein